MQKVIVYIDGFNLYFGLKEKGWKQYYWLDLYKLAISFLKNNQKLICTKYFTSRIKSHSEKAKRQSTYIEALETLKNIKIFYGHYLINTIECKKCGDIFPKPNEKMTDVNIAVELMTDAFQNSYDTALLISADSDLAGPLKKIRRLFPEKRIIVAFPPARSSYSLRKYASASFTIGRKKLKDCQFPDQVRKKDGFILSKPLYWK